MSRIFAPSSVPPVAPPPPAATTVSAPQAYPRLSDWLFRIQEWCLWLAAFLIPLFFNPWTLDAVELNKQTLLIALTSVAFLAWLGEGIARKRFALSKSWLHLVVVLFGLAYLLVSVFSENRYLSLVGSSGQMSWPFATVAALVVFYLIVVNHVRSLTQVYNLAFVFLASSGLVALYGLLQLLGWFPFGFVAITRSQNFNTVGSLYSLAMYLTAPLVMASAIVFHGCRDRVCVLGSGHAWGQATRAMLWATIALSLLDLILVDFWAAWLTLLFGTLLTVGLGYVRTRKFHRPERFVLPGMLVVVSVLLLIFNTPFRPALPSEVAPSLKASWEIARATLQAHPLFGSGPETWIEDYAQYRAQPVNLSPFWNVRFERGISGFLTLVATVGLVGTALWLLLLISVIAKSASHLLSERNEDHWYAFLTVFVGWAAMAFAVFFYNYNLAHQFAFWLLLALLGSFVSRDVLVWNAKANRGAFAWLSILLVIGGVAAISMGWIGGERLYADAAFAQAIGRYQANQPMDAVIDKLTQATALNPWDDVYERNLSQAYLIRGLNTIQNKALPDPLKASQDDIAAAVREAKGATALAPSNVDNWANLARVYANIASFTQGAADFAIQNYQQAIQREPENPQYHDELATIYLMRADAYQAMTQAKDAKTQADARANMADSLNLATQELNRAITAKPDYLPAHYHLGLVYERQGRVPEATTELEQALRADNKNTGLAFELALLYERGGKPEQAQNLLQQVVNAEPNNANALWYLSAVDEQLGKLPEALQAIQTLSQQLPDNAAVRDRLAYLDHLIASKSAPAAPPLPEPLPEGIHGPAQNNPIAH